RSLGLTTEPPGVIPVARLHLALAVRVDVRYLAHGRRPEGVDPGAYIGVLLLLGQGLQHVHRMRRVVHRPGLQVLNEADLAAAEVELRVERLLAEAIEGGEELRPVL